MMIDNGSKIDTRSQIGDEIYTTHKRCDHDRSSFEIRPKDEGEPEEIARYAHEEIVDEDMSKEFIFHRNI